MTRLSSGQVAPCERHGPGGIRGASVGLNLGWKHLQVDVDYQRALNTPNGLQHEPETWLMRVGLQI